MSTSWCWFPSRRCWCWRSQVLMLSQRPCSVTVQGEGAFRFLGSSSLWVWVCEWTLQRFWVWVCVRIPAGSLSLDLCESISCACLQLCTHTLTYSSYSLSILHADDASVYSSLPIPYVWLLVLWFQKILPNTFLAHYLARRLFLYSTVCSVETDRHINGRTDGRTVSSSH